MKFVLGDKIYAQTHANCLNYILGTKYRGWQRTCYNYNSNTIIWMFYKDNQERAGYRNKIVGDRLIEENVFHVKKWDGKPVNPDINRIAFSINYYGSKRVYTFEGVFKYCPEESETYKFSVYKRISTEIDIQRVGQ